MAALLRGQPALRRILSVLGQSRLKEATNIRLNVQVSRHRIKLMDGIVRNFATKYQQKSTFGIERIQSLRPSAFSSIPKNIDDALGMVDREVRRVGRIKKDVIMQIYSAMQESGHVAGHQGLLLLRCLGTVMVDETPAARVKIAETLWTGLKALGTKYDVTHYNALLQVYLQNEHKFSPAEFLSTAESAGIKPNRVTYQRLIAGYCLVGDVQGANQILEHMKTSNLPINENVFNSLIVGNMRAGDVESAKEILNIMRGSNINPSADTYSTLMSEHARKGDIESIEKVANEAQESQVIFQPNDFFAVLHSLCANGYTQHVDKVLSMVDHAHVFGYNQKCVNAIIQMVAQGHDDVAHKLFLSMQHFTPKEVSEVTFGRFFIKEMVKHERPMETVVNIMKDLTSRGLNTDRLDFIAQWALVYEKPAYAMEAFGMLDKEGLPVRTHYFWPIFLAYKKQKNVQGIYDAIKVMEEKVTESHDFIYTLHEQIVPCLLDVGEDFQTIKDKMMELNVMEGDLNFAGMIHHIKRGNNAEAVKFAKEKETRFHHSVLQQYLFAWFRATKDLDSVVEILSLAQENAAGAMHNMKVTDLATRFLFNYMEMFKNDSPQVEQLVRSMIEKKVGVSHQWDGFSQKLGISADVIQELTSLEVEHLQPDNRQSEQSSFASKAIGELEQILSEHRVKDTNIRGPLRWLLEKHCQAGNISRVNEIQNELNDLGFVYTPDLIRSLMHLAACYQKDITETKKYMEMLESQHPNFRAYVSEVINLAALHAAQGNVADAITTLNDYHVKHQSYMEQKGLGDSYLNEAQCVNLIKSCCQGLEKMEMTTEVMNTLFEHGYIKNSCYNLLKTFVDGYVENGDLDGAVAAVEYCHKHYGRVPLFDSIFKTLIEKEDAAKLQGVMDMVIANMGEMQALHHLMFCCVDCGKETQARRILETPGMRAMMDLLEIFSNQLIIKKKVDTLESLVNVTRGLFGLDREQMLFLLIKGYCHEDNYEKALNVLTLMEEENINPRGRTLRYLGNALKSKNMEVPFEIPEAPVPIPKQSFIEQDQVSSASGLSPQEVEHIKQAAAGNVISLKEIKESLGGTLKPKFVTEMAYALLRSKRKGSLKYFVNDLAMMGDVQSLEELRTLNLKVFNIGLIHMALSKAHLESGAPEKILERLQNDPKNLSKYLSNAVCNKFQVEYPSLFKQFENVILSGADDGNMQALSFLWQHYCMTDQLDKCTKLIEQYPTLHQDLRIAEPCVYAKSNDREDLLQYLIDISKAHGPNHKFAYSYMLGLKCQQNNWQGALDLLEKIEEDGYTTDDLRPLPLAVLESLLVANNQAVPWQVGKYGQVSAKTQSSESSRSHSYESQQQNINTGS